MPLYLYRCINGHEVEELEPTTSPRKRDCPQCGAESWRVIAAASIPKDGTYSFADGVKP